MKARCLQECYHGASAWKYTPEGGDNQDGIYDVDPLDPIAQYFEFPEGTEKYHKVFGTVIEGEEIPEITDGAPAKPQSFTARELREKLSELGVKWLPTMNKATLMSLLLAAQAK